MTDEKLISSAEKLPRKHDSEQGKGSERQTKSMALMLRRTSRSTRWTIYGRRGRGSRKMNSNRIAGQRRKRLARKGWKRGRR